MAVTLDAVVLPDDSFWIDEFGWGAVDSSEGYTLGGRLVVQHFNKLQGRTISLKSPWLSRDTLAELEGKRDTPGLIMTLTLPDARTFQVKFRHTEAVVLSVTPVIERPDYSVSSPECPTYFDVIINLIQI